MYVQEHNSTVIYTVHIAQAANTSLKSYYWVTRHLIPGSFCVLVYMYEQNVRIVLRSGQLLHSATQCEHAPSSPLICVAPAAREIYALNPLCIHMLDQTGLRHTDYTTRQAVRHM